MNQKWADWPIVYCSGFFRFCFHSSWYFLTSNKCENRRETFRKSNTIFIRVIIMRLICVHFKWFLEQTTHERERGSRKCDLWICRLHSFVQQMKMVMEMMLLFCRLYFKCDDVVSFMVAISISKILLSWAPTLLFSYTAFNK